jgi:glycosyltransferase involved in cell wall biosynthesis
MRHDSERLPPISVLILAKNEEAAITDCVASARRLSDDVHVIDSSSSDRTVELATSTGAAVTQYRWNGDYPKKKQWSLSNVRTAHAWCLMLDADERVSPELADEIRRLFAAGSLCSAYDVPILYYWYGKPLRHGLRVHKRALVDKTAVRFPDVADLDAPGAWEVEGHYQPVVTGVTGRIGAPIHHDDPDPLSDWFGRHNRYSDWEAHIQEHPALRRQVRQFKTRLGRMMDELPFKPLVVFLYAYVLRCGFLDGRAGLDYAMAQAFYRWQVSVKRRDLRFRRPVEPRPTPAEWQ